MHTESAQRSSPTSKHILNAQVAIRAPCCKQWFDCAECHAEAETHRLAKTTEMVFMCKKCKKAFRKSMAEYDESDEYCPHCDNHYVSARLSYRGQSRIVVVSWTAGHRCEDAASSPRRGGRGSQGRRSVRIRAYTPVICSVSEPIYSFNTVQHAEGRTRQARSFPIAFRAGIYRSHWMIWMLFKFRVYLSTCFPVGT